MNPLTLVKRIQQINSKEAALGISDDASWHAKYKDSAYVFVGGIPFDLTEGDLLAIFSQYGEIVDVNLVRDKGTGKSKGFAFVAYEDQRSTNLAVDNLNGAQVVGRTIRVDHVNKYKKKEEEDEEAERQKREARGVCRAFQRGDCNRGAGCKFSHDEQRAANTGWGHEDTKSARWANDKFEGSMKNEKQSAPLNRVLESAAQERLDKGARNSRVKGNEGPIKSDHKRSELNSRKQDGEHEKPSEWKKEMIHKEDWDKQATDRRSRKHDSKSTSRKDGDNREEKRSRRHESESYHREDCGRGDKRSSHDRDSSSHQYKGRDDDHRHRSHDSHR